MTSDDNDENDDEISTANVDVSAPELLDNHRVVTRGKDNSASIIKTITFTIVSQLQNHGQNKLFWYKSPERRYFWHNRVAGDI